MREGENMTISERQERILELLRQEPKISVAPMPFAKALTLASRRYGGT